MRYEPVPNVAVAFSTPMLHTGGTALLREVDVSFADRGLHLIRGVNGSGKTTLLHALAGLMPDYQQQVSWWGQRVSELSVQERARLRFMLFQDSTSDVPWTVREYVALATRRPSGSKTNLAVENALDKVSMQEKSQQLVSTLSGGEWARVQLAQALASGTKLLMCDEPDAALDDEGRTTLVLLLQALPDITCIVISHDPSRFESAADSVTTVSNGLVMQVS